MKRIIAILVLLSMGSMFSACNIGSMLPNGTYTAGGRHHLLRNAFTVKGNKINVSYTEQSRCGQGWTDRFGGTGVPYDWWADCSLDITEVYEFKIKGNEIMLTFYSGKAEMADLTVGGPRARGPENFVDVHERWARSLNEGFNSRMNGQEIFLPFERKSDRSFFIQNIQYTRE